MESMITMKNEELDNYILNLQKTYDDLKAKNYHYDMSRGKPCREQLDISDEIMDSVKSTDSFKAMDGTDCRNYGVLDGIPEAKELFSKILEVSTKEIIIGGNSSLNMMFDSISRAMTHGVLGSKTPWGKLPKVKFLCPSPGYDRHFAVTEFFNIEMIIVDMKSDGPDMDAVEKLVRDDASIKGIWCTPKYSNPDGITYSDAVVDRLAGLKPAAEDFRIFWDNAYTMHHLTDQADSLKNILVACREAGNPDMVYLFSSTSKISYAGAGIAIMGASEANVAFLKKQMTIQTIGSDKLNQLRHVKYYKSYENIVEHMKKHAAILKPKFDIVLNILENELAPLGIASWNKPNGGYFISFNALDGCASAIVAKAAEAGVIMTKAGATYPYGKDPKDKNIRIAPTFPSLTELTQAIELFCVCTKLVCANKIREDRKNA